MKTPENKNKKLPAELDTELQNLSDSEVQGLREVWDLASFPASSTFPDPSKLDQIWNAVDQKISEKEREPQFQRKDDRPSVERRQTARIIPMRWLAVAAVLVIGAIGARMWLAPVTLTVPYGETASVQLSDGSMVELNSGSTIKYARSFGDERRVSLQGEAFFDVEKEARPFIVETFNGSVRVLGTTFNVKAWDDESKTVVALQSGSVQVAGLVSEDNPKLLNPGQTARIQNEEILLSPTEEGLVPASLAWRSGDFSYSEEELRAVLHDIERRFDTQIVVSSEAMGSRKTKYSRKNPGSASVVLEELCASLGLAFRTTNEGFEVFDPQ